MAPISGIRCAHWRVSFWRWIQRKGGKQFSYEEVGSVEEGADWRLEDETGQVAVDADRAQLKWKGLKKSPSHEARPPIYDDLLRKAGIADLDCDFVEHHIPVDRPMLAQGMVEQFPKGEYLTGGPDLVLDPTLREDRLGPSKGTLAAGFFLAAVGACMVAGGLLVPAEPEPTPAPPPPGWVPARPRDSSELPRLPAFDDRK
ncbi:MAG: hypothetical protein QM765_33860 [Myxococcales bacterium]